MEDVLLQLVRASHGVVTGVKLQILLLFSLVLLCIAMILFRAVLFWAAVDAFSDDLELAVMLLLRANTLCHKIHRSSSFPW